MSFSQLECKLAESSIHHLERVVDIVVIYILFLKERVNKAQQIGITHVENLDNIGPITSLYKMVSRVERTTLPLP